MHPQVGPGTHTQPRRPTPISKPAPFAEPIQPPNHHTRHFWNNICPYIALIIFKIEIMSIVKVIEVIASSENSFDDAVKNAVAEVSKTVKNIDSVYVKDFKCHVKEQNIVSYGVICKVSFRVES